MPKVARFAAVVAVAGTLGLASASPALAGTSNFGQKIYMCATMMLPYYLGSNGSITMTMPGTATTMYFRTFGDMVTYMQSQPMCS